MKKFTTKQDNKSDVVFTRKVLFEKYDKYLNAILLTDFDTWHYSRPNLLSLDLAIMNLNSIIKENTVFGELEQPESTVISLENISHSIEDIYRIGYKTYGFIKFIDTPNGKILKSLIEEKCEVKFNLRATGNANNEETTINEIITWDATII